MRTIAECVEDIKSILNNMERTQEYTGETSVDIDELINEILAINANEQCEKCKDCAGCTQCKVDESNIKQYERDRTIEECKTAAAKAICIGCGYLKDLKCTYNGGNCGVSKPMLENVMKALDNVDKNLDKEKQKYEIM